eukprot:scaffold7242_cov400-Prasinococcus_capsulatus_cf.AAC.7
MCLHIAAGRWSVVERALAARGPRHLRKPVTRPPASPDGSGCASGPFHIDTLVRGRLATSREVTSPSPSGRQAQVGAACRVSHEAPRAWGGGRRQRRRGYSQAHFRAQFGHALFACCAVSSGEVRRSAMQRSACRQRCLSCLWKVPGL